MSDENANTADLTIDEKLDRLLQRLTALETQGGSSTRPLFDRLLQEMVATREALSDRLTAVERELRAINNRLAIFSEDINRVRGDLKEHGARLDELERRPN